MKGIIKAIIILVFGLATSPLVNAGNLIVGDYNGTANVSPSGAATFSIPIECPKGVNGMEPQIKLVYNSQSGIGNAGYGWNLCASSVITKANAVPYYDGKLLPINYDKSGDYIALDGQRLIKYKEISSNEVEFRTENNNYNRIVRYGSNGSYTFKVYTTNGNILTYNQLKEGAGYYNGNLGWYLTNIEDPYTNYITYKYYIETDESKKNISEVNLSSIEYGGNRTKGTAHVCKISIEYKAIADICSLPSNYTYHIDGFKKNHNKAISKISTYSNNILNNEIKLIYQVNELNHHFLQKITLYGNNGDYLKDISLTNKSINKTLKETGNTTKYVSNYSQKDILYKENQTKKNWMATDYDGDGDNDIISFSIVQANQVIGSTIYTHFGSYFQYFKNNNGNFDYDKFYYTENLFSIDAYGGALSCHFTSKQKPNALLPCLACFPKNLKDIKDITQEKIETSPSKTINIVNVNNPSDYYGVILNSEHTEMPPYSCADLNRDGYDDIVIVEKVPYNKNYICKIFWGKSAEKLSDLIGNCQVSTITFTCAGTINKVAISDMNKDGLMDIIAISNSGNSILKNTGYSSGNLCGFSCVGYKEDLLYPKDNLFEFGDFNGDGICDFIRGGATRRLLYLGNSDFSFTMKSFPNIVAANTQTCSFSADIDNDMKTELFIINNKKLYSYKYDGSDFNEWQTATPTLTSKINLIIADFTGDGRTDIVSEAKALLSNETNANKFFLTEISSANDAELLNNITTPLHSYTYSYSPLTDKSIYTKSVTFPESYNFVNLLCPLYVVNGISVDGNKTTYTYSDAVCEVTGKGFLGFLSTKSDNAFSNMTETISNSYKTKPALLYTSSSTLSTKSGAFKKTSYSYSFPYLTGSKVYDQQLVSITESDLLNSTTTKTQYSSYKLNVPTNVCVTYGDGSSSSIALTTNQNTTYNMVLPIKKVVTKANKDGSISQTSTYTYNNKLSLASEISAYGTDKAITNNYLYDSFGNVIEKKTQAIDCETVKKNYTYTPSGRFLSTESSSDGISTSYTFNEDYGRLSKSVSKIGSISYTTTYNSFDGFNNCLKKTLPDGRTETISSSFINYDSMKGRYNIKRTLKGSSNKEEYYDENNHVVKSIQTYVTGKRLNKMYSYDKCGRLTSDYQLTTSNTPTDQAQNSYTYDEYGRIERIVSLTGTTNYTYEKLKTTITNPLGTFVKEYNAAGQLIKSTENGKSVTFSYYPSGLTKTSTDAENNLTVSFEYDVAGNRTKITDPDVGTITSEYDSYGREIVHTTEKGAVITHDYDSKGRLIEESDGSTKSIFTYNSNNQLTKESSNNYSCEYKYDSFGRITQKDEVIAGTTFSTKYTYGNNYDGPSTMKLPSGLPLSYEYDEYGNMKLAKCQDKNIWIPSQIDTKGRLTEETLYNVTRKYEYSKSGMLTRETAYYGTTGLMDLSYSYSSMKLSQKTDALSSNTEKYTYDNLNRLSNVQIINSEYNKSLSGNVTYDARNNMTKTFDSHWTSISYGNGKAPHQVSSISYSQYVPNGNRTVSFDSYRMVKQIVDGPYTYKITYRPNHERCMTQMYKSGSLQRTTYYCDNYERVIDANGKEKKIHYLCGDNGLVGIYVIDNGKDSFFTAVTDRQNSLTAVMANAGKKVERFSYKPWGMRRDPKRWDLNNATDYAARFSRGYCMHEHVRELGLIDMGGRMYDEHTHQFLSPDPYMQDPESWLSHNRFSYCMHNPVMYTDPNGEYCLIDDLLAMGLGGVVNVVSNLVSGNIHSFGQGCAYFGIGAVSAEVSLYASPIVGGSLLGGANSALTSYIQTGSVNGQSMAMGAFMGGATSYLGSIVGGKASAWISKWTGKLASPILKSWLPQAFGGSASGFTLSTGMSLLNGESLETALKEGGKGAASGFAIGSLSGIAYGFKNAKSENVSPWTGKTRTNTDDLTPNEAAETFGITGTLDRINRGEKLPHKNDGTVYHNKGGELPEYEDGYYHEYVHPIDGQRFPGAHRVIKGNGGEIYYTPDHYHNFFRIK